MYDERAQSQEHLSKVICKNDKTLNAADRQLYFNMEMHLSNIKYLFILIGSGSA